MIRNWLQVFLALSVLSLAPSEYANAGKIKTPDALIQAATQNGSVRIIVTLQEPQLPDRASKSPWDFDQILKSKVSSIQSAVLDKLPARALVGVARRFDFTPQFAATVTPDGLTMLAKDSAVRAIHEDRLSHPLLDLSVPHIFPGNDISPHTGNGQVTAVLDTGVDKSHPFLDGGKVVSEACYSTTYTHPTEGWASNSACPGGVPSSTAADSGTPCNLSYEGCDHGTHVAGIAAGFQSDTMHGVAKDGGILAVQVFSEFTGLPINICSSNCALSYTSDQIDGLNRVYALRNIYDIAAVNMSLGGGGPYNTACDSDPTKPSIDLLRGEGIATIVASGNDGYTAGIAAPACISSAIAVGATNNIVDTRAGFSNVGDLLDLYAPGVDINSSVPGGGFESWPGTSMATPHVAGAWAIMKDAKPTASVNDILTAFKSTGVDVTSEAVTRKRIDVDEALVELLSGTPPPSGDDDFILLVMPPILAAGQNSTTPPPPVQNPQWGAVTELCCSTSSLTYRVTQGAQSRYSTLASCSGTPTFSGFLTTTPGSKYFSHNVTSSGCGNLEAAGSQYLQSGKRYLWVAEYNGGNPQFVLYSENLSSTATTNLSATNYSNRGVPNGMVIEASGPLILEQDGHASGAFQSLIRPY